MASQITHHEWATIDHAEASKTWEVIPWELIESKVNKLQSRIAKAIRKGKDNLAKKLQYLLTNSYYAKLLAVRKVTTNQGKETSGVDGKIWSTPATKYKAALKLTNDEYRAKPLRRIYIDKRLDKKRPLGIPTMYDRAIQALYALALDPVSETKADKVSFGFRKYRSCDDAKEYLFKLLGREVSAQWILEADIKGCFDNISHEWLMENIPLESKILNQFLRSGYKYNKQLFPTEKGTPQGGIISPILANMTLDGMLDLLKRNYWTNHLGTVNRRYNDDKVNLVRYADDFVVTAKSKEVLEDIKELIGDFLDERGLELSKRKTKITHINQGFDFLGWNFRKYSGKLIIKPSKESYKSITSKIRKLIKDNGTIKQERLIKILNPVIRGWCNYHSTACSKETYQQLDSEIFKTLWRWSKRRHPSKSKKWIMNRYWITKDNRNWIFATKDKELISATDTEITRHCLIKFAANPYLPEYNDYYLKRNLN